jgi:hypothetical protein
MPLTFELILNDVADGQRIYTGEPGIRVPLDRVVIRSALGLRMTAPASVPSSVHG